MKNLFRILLFTCVLSSFGIQAMSETKAESENNEVVELREKFPKSIQFLDKVLGKKGLPSDITIKIINDYLKTNLAMDINNNATYNLSRVPKGSVIAKAADFWKKDPQAVEGYNIDDVVIQTGTGKKIKIKVMGSYVAGGGCYIDGTYVKKMKQPVLDINSQISNKL